MSTRAYEGVQRYNTLGKPVGPVAIFLFLSLENLLTIGSGLFVDETSACFVTHLVPACFPPIFSISNIHSINEYETIRDEFQRM